MTEDRNKENRETTKNNSTKFNKKRIITTSVALAIVVAVSFAAYSQLQAGRTDTQAQAQSATLGEVLRSINPINEKPLVVKEKLSSVNGIPLTEVAKSTTSTTTQEDANGNIVTVANDGQAEIALLRAGPDRATEDNVIGFRITNTGQDSFKIVSLGVEGQTKSGYTPLQALAVSEKNFDQPNVTVTDAVVLNPGESFSGHIIGKWKATGIDEDITEFHAGAVYRYENGDSVKVWSIGTDLYSLS